MTTDERSADEGIVIRCKAGDESAFNELIERYKDMAYSMAYNMTGSREGAEDIAQEAFVVLYSKINRFREESSFKTWFYKVILNLCRSHIRKRKVVSFFTFSLQQNNDMGPIEAPTNITPEKKAMSRQSGMAIFAALKNLSVRQREIFSMKHLKGMKINEIAEILDCSEGTVKSHLFRAVKRLQLELGGIK